MADISNQPKSNFKIHEHKNHYLAITICLYVFAALCLFLTVALIVTAIVDEDLHTAKALTGSEKGLIVGTALSAVITPILYLLAKHEAKKYINAVESEPIK
ncbi:MAG: hypothetical protein LBM76_01460 [Mycoplasmataceae bacterium]|jgi:uncharacterized membrane protein|nr:hypothetical protein [Mycoplasmataceae bacterium]